MTALEPAPCLGLAPWPAGALVRLHDTETGRALSHQARIHGHRPDRTGRGAWEYRLILDGDLMRCGCCGCAGYFSDADLELVAS